MRKKINLLILILAFTIVITPVKAVMHADGGGGTQSGPISDTKTCVDGSYSGLSLGNLHAIRMSMVDSNGNRVSGTNSIDLTNHAGATANLTKFDLHIADNLADGVYVRRISGNHTRNELIKGVYAPSFRSYGIYQIYYWNKLPYFNYSGSTNGGYVLRRYFETSFGTTDIQDMKTIFRLMNYNGYEDRTIYNNHYILIEPIFYLFTSYPTSEIVDDACVITQTFYYGTGTEIFKMISESPFYQYGSIYGTFQDIGTRVHDTMTVAGLREADSIMNNRDAIKRYALTSNPAYGLASMHVWMIDVMEDNHSNDNGCYALDGSFHEYPNPLPSDFNELDFINNNCPSTTTEDYCIDGNHIPRYYSSRPDLTREEFERQYCSDCANTITVETHNTCNSNTGTWQLVEDTQDWNCIFNQWNQSPNTYEGEFYNPNGDTQFADTTQAYSNRYCTVACRENVLANFPSEFNALAGGRFTIGNYSEGAASMGPITMRGSTTCKTGYNKETGEISINTQKFVRDYAAANEEVANAWNEVVKVKVKIEALKNAENNRSSNPTGSGQHNCLPQTALTYCYIFSGYSNDEYQGNVGQRRCYPLNGRTIEVVCNDHESRGELLNHQCSVETVSECVREHDGQQYYDIYTYTGSASGNLIHTTQTGRNSGNLIFNWTETFYEHSDRGRDFREIYGKNNYDAELTNAINAYNTKVAYRDNLLKQIKACSNYQRTYSEFQPAVTFIYDDDYYKDDHVLASKQTTEAYSVYNNNDNKHVWSTSGYSYSNSAYAIDYSGVYGDSASIFSWNCNLNNVTCERSSVIYPTNRNVEQTTIKTFEYMLPENTYRYITKYGTAYNSIEEIIESNIYPGETTTELIETGKVRILDYSSLPLVHSVGNCKDTYRIEYYYSNGEATLFGTSQKFIQYNKVTSNTSTVFNNVLVSEDLGYKCNYNIVQNFYNYETINTTSNTSEYTNEYEENSTSYVYNESTEVQYDYFDVDKICGEVGTECEGSNCSLNIIYRSISLEDPFPGESGKTRVSGSNWQGIVKNTDKSFIESYITNNRNVKTDDVYKLRPIYEFVLTPTNMRRIRQYNNKQKDNYNDDYTLSCYSNGDYCQSKFLYEGIGAGYFEFTKENPNGGTCYGANITNWDTCRYTTVGGS